MLICCKNGNVALVTQDNSVIFITSALIVEIFIFHDWKLFRDNLENAREWIPLLNHLQPAWIWQLSVSLSARLWYAYWFSPNDNIVVKNGITQCYRMLLFGVAAHVKHRIHTWNQYHRRNMRISMLGRREMYQNIETILAKNMATKQDQKQKQKYESQVEMRLKMIYQAPPDNWMYRSAKSIFFVNLFSFVEQFNRFE